MTNFQADQAGLLRFRFHLVPHAARPLGESIKAVLPYAHPLAAHLYAERGPAKAATASLLNMDLGTLLLSRLEADGDGVALTLLNPSDAAQEAAIGSGSLVVNRAVRTTLSGVKLEDLPCKNGLKLSVGPRAWIRVAVYQE
jgi:hypothetical protein